MNNTTVVPVGEREWDVRRGIAELCLSEKVWLIDIINGFSVFENHSKSRLRPDGRPSNHSSNSIRPVIERHALCLPASSKNDTAPTLTSHLRTEEVTIGAKGRLRTLHFD